MKQLNLKKIKNDLLTFALTIESVLDVEVIIVNSSLERIVSTSINKRNNAIQVDKNSVFSKALTKNMSFIVDNPREHLACASCKQKKSCTEFAQVCCPISENGEVYGVIGLIADSEQQRDNLLHKKNNLIAFLENISKMIVSRMKEDERNRELINLYDEMQTIINSIKKPVISIDENGSITRYNNMAENYFGVLLKSEPRLLSSKIKNTIIKSNASEYEYDFQYKNKKFRGFFRKYMTEDGTSNVLVFDEIKEVIGLVNTIIGGGMQTKFDDIIGSSEALYNVKNMAKEIANSDSTILITGESGTGKELFARAIHFSSKRKHYPFIAINCAAIPDHLLESELFGYIEGAFTGAIKGGKIGKFELADKGTIFLDEIGDLQLHLQAKLLRVLQDRSITRIGSNKSIDIDVRIISATNQNLEKKVASGEFREDMYYRINVVPIEIPPLNSRRTDIYELTEYFVKKIASRVGKKIEGVSPDTLDLLMNYHWKGNVRELENLIDYTVNMARGEVIQKSDLPERFHFTVRKSIYLTPIKELELLEIKKALKLYGRKKEGIAKVISKLGISRATLYRRMKELD